MLRALDAETRPGGNTYAPWGIVLTAYAEQTWRELEDLSGRGTLAFRGGVGSQAARGNSRRR